MTPEEAIAFALHTLIHFWLPTFAGLTLSLVYAFNTPALFFMGSIVMCIVIQHMTITGRWEDGIKVSPAGITVIGWITLFIQFI
ncbi:MAG: hypothetical protein OXF06_08590 [Bacteroidetes bacterium]|nr:hypothetical protein [Bacteroidota bacterium]